MRYSEFIAPGVCYPQTKRSVCEPGTPERASNHRFSAITFHHAHAPTHPADPLHSFTRKIAKRTQFHRPIPQHATKHHLRNEANSVRPAPPSADPQHPPTRKYQTNPISPATDCKQDPSASPGEPDSIPILQPCHPTIAKPFSASRYTGISHAQSSLRAFPHCFPAHRPRSARPRNLPAPH